MKSEKKLVTMKLDTHTRRTLRAMAKERGVSMTSLVVSLVKSEQAKSTSEKDPDWELYDLLGQAWDLISKKCERK